MSCVVCTCIMYIVYLYCIVYLYIMLSVHTGDCISSKDLLVNFCKLGWLNLELGHKTIMCAYVYVYITVLCVNFVVDNESSCTAIKISGKQLVKCLFITSSQ